MSTRLSVSAHVVLVMTIACVVTLELTACSTQETHENLPQKNIEQWVMPLDQFSQSNGAAADYAELLLDRPCMEEAGYDWPVPYRDFRQTSATRNAVGRHIMTESSAAEWGYHQAKVTLSNAAEWGTFTAMTNAIGDQEFSTLRSCQAKARKIIPIVDDETNYTANLVNAAIDASVNEPDVEADAAKWRKCMIPAGISDLPQTPTQMPSHFQMQLYAIADPQSTASPAEIAAASRDFKCRVSSGYRTAKYNAEWSAQVKLLTENRDQLDRNKSVIDKSAAKVAKTIAANAPAH